MATLTAYGASVTPGLTELNLNVLSLSAAQTGNGASTNIVDRASSLGPVVLEITTAVGATPTCTYLIEGSLNGTTWFPIQNADAATPQTLVVTTFTITAAGVTRRIIPINTPFRYLRVTYSANTNVTNTVDAYMWTEDINQ